MVISTVQAAWVGEYFVAVFICTLYPGVINVKNNLLTLIMGKWMLIYLKLRNFDTNFDG